MQSHYLSPANVRESLLMALGAIRSSKLRSVLTMLGIVVGIFSIISVMTALSVLRNSIEQGMTQLGANTFQVQKFSMDFNTTPEQRRRMRNRKNITYEQAIQVRDKASLAESVGIEGSENGNIVFWSGRKTNPNVNVYGETIEGQETNDWSVALGPGADGAGSRHGPPRDRPWFGGRGKALPPVRRSPRGDGPRGQGVYQVIGVYAKKGASLGGNQDNFVATAPDDVF